MWGEASKTTVYILNRVPFKSIEKTPYKLQTNKKSSLGYMHVWRCPTEAKAYNLQEKSLDSRIVSGYFIGYPQRLRGYRFYCSTHTRRIVETDRVIFLEDSCVNGSIVRHYVFSVSQEDIVPY